MTIQSYLVYPGPGLQARALEALAGIPGCEILPAENRSVMVLVTETPGKSEQRELERKLEELEPIAHVALVSGWTEEYA